MQTTKKTVAALCAASFLLAGGCGKPAPPGREAPPVPDEPSPPVRTEAPAPPDRQETPEEKTPVSFEAGLSMSLDSAGAMKITRRAAGSTPMGKAETWTVFVYLCGTDLESEDGMATADMQEMLDASTGKNVRFVVQTAGTASWQNKTVSPDKIERYEICGGEMYRADSQSSASMGSGETLADFLKWGVKTYPAEKMGVVLWNHGGGSITGVCFDERHEFDSLSLSEINGAFAEAAGEMTDKFEFAGFDACLMGTVECANVLATYARYMYGSQESEPGYGWNYTAIGNYLGKNPSADGAALGRVVCDTYHEACARAGEASMATFSIIDLSAMDPLVTAFNDYAKNLYEASEDNAVLSNVVRNIKEADNYGGNNRSEGYTNMVDLAGIVRAGADWADGADAVLPALDRAVIYSKNGSGHSAACGLSAYYPLSIQGSSELKLFGEIAISPYYLSFVDRSAYGLSNNGSTDEYDSEPVFDFWGATWNEDSVWDWFHSEENWDLCGSGEYWDSYHYEPTGESALIEFYDEPALLDDGSYAFSLTDESLPFVASVQGVVFMLSDDGEDLIELGITADILADWESGIFMDNFDGCWFSLPDGQNLAVYLVEECDGYDVYTTPVLLNGEETNLRLSHRYRDGTVSIDGAWSGIDENGMAGRGSYQLEKGDSITPLYNATSLYSDDEYLYYGEEYIFDGDPEIFFDLLYDGYYSYGFNIDDIYGDYYVTDFVNFEVDGEHIYFDL